MPKVTPFLMYADNCEEAADLYASVFKNAKVLSRVKGPDGKVSSVCFEVEGQQFRAYNGGEHFTFNDGMSIFVECEDQEEVDQYWNKLTENGGDGLQCGWLKDKFGVRWQIIPKQLMEALSNPNPEKAQKAMGAMLQMTKIDIAKIEEAAS